MLALSTYMGHARLESTYWYLESTPQLMADIARPLRVLYAGRKPMTSIAPHITAFLRERLPLQRGASPHTCESYAYTFQLLFEFASNRHKVTPSKLYLEPLLRTVIDTDASRS
jgi:hypothetical protein